MTVRTRVRRSADGWQKMRDEFVDALADGGLLYCPGTAGALLDIGDGASSHGGRVTPAGADTAHRSAGATRPD